MITITRILVGAGIMVSATLANADTVSLVTTDGKTFENARVVRAEPDGLMLATDSGVAKVPFAKCPTEIQGRFGYDPEAAAAHAQKIAIENAEAQRAGREARAAAAQAELAVYENHAKSVDAQNALRAALEGSSGPTVKVIGRIVSSLGEGTLLIDGGNEEEIRKLEVDAMDRRRQQQLKLDVENILANGRPSMASAGNGGGAAAAPKDPLSGFPRVYGQMVIVNGPKDGKGRITWKLRSVGEREVGGKIFPAYAMVP